MYNIGDTHGNYGEITRISNSCIWFGEKRFLKKTFHKKNLNVILKYSPNTIINWRDEKSVDTYYETFRRWSGVCRNGDTRKLEIFKVKNNKVFYNGEYYLPYYNNDKKYLKDGYVFAFCFKMCNTYWQSERTSNTINVNVFVVEREIPDKQYKYGINKELNYQKLLDKKISKLEYLKLIDLNHVNSIDLDLFRDNYTLLLNSNIFPYTTNNVTFMRDNTFLSERIAVHHRNRSGSIEIDNGYRGSAPFGNDYYVICKVRPNFTNVHSAIIGVEGKQITFDKNMLNALASKIVPTWDIAIEKNYINYKI